MKYILLFLVITILSCGDRATESTTQTTEAQSTSATSAPVSNSAVGASPTTSSNNPAEQTASQTPAAASASQQNATTQTTTSFKSPLLGTHWKLLELNGKNMEGKTAKEMYLLLDPGSPQFKAHSGCNLVMGEAKRPGGNQLLFTNLLNTTSECKTPELDAEFQKAIEDVTGYDLKGNILELTKKGKVTVLKYVAK